MGSFYHSFLSAQPTIAGSECRCPVIYSVVFCTIITIGGCSCVCRLQMETEREKGEIQAQRNEWLQMETWGLLGARQQPNSINENVFLPPQFSVLASVCLLFFGTGRVEGFSGREATQQITDFLLAPHSATQITNFSSYVFRKLEHACERGADREGTWNVISELKNIFYDFCADVKSTAKWGLHQATLFDCLQPQELHRTVKIIN